MVPFADVCYFIGVGKLCWMMTASKQVRIHPFIQASELLIPTVDGNLEWIQLVLGPYEGDLQELYMLARQYGSNFSQLSRACNGCNVEGNLSLIF